MALVLAAPWISVQSVFSAASDVSTVGSQSNASSPSLTNGAQVLALSPDQARTGLKVQLRGMVTFFHQGMGMFVQDETAGVFVYLTSPFSAKPGRYVEVTGVSNQGRYSPIVDSPQVHFIETGPAISPRPASLADINMGGLDSQWVVITGVIRSQKSAGTGLRLELVDPPHRISVWIPDCSENPPVQLEGNRVTLRGVVGTLSSEQGVLGGFQIFAENLGDVSILPKKSGATLSSLPVPIRDLRNPSLRIDGIGRVRVQGIVTLCWPGRELFIQDPTGGLEIRGFAGPEQLAPGNSVEVVGFLGPVLNAPVLEDAVIRKLAKDEVLQPAAVQFEDLRQDRHRQELVQVDATFVDWASSASNTPALVVQSQGQLMTAWLNLPSRQGVMPGLEPRSKLRLVGVCRADNPSSGSGSTFSFLLRSPEDVTLLAPPLTSLHPESQVATVTAILAGAALVVALWYSQKQRRQTEHVLQLQATLRAEMQQGEQQLRRSMEERDRIGRDLHDDIIQSIYAVGLNLEDCRRVIRESPQKAEARVASAIETLNSTIRSVRGFLSGLEPKILNGREFKTALKSLALTSGDNPTPFHIEVEPSAANNLTSAQATQLLHIAKEAMSNSLRHAQASAVSVSLHPVSTGVRLEVRDNGIGFDPQNLAGLGHGLRNMATRAREIAGDLQILSAPGQGCCILVTVPQRNPNERL